jgi:hypothetical protein
MAIFRKIHTSFWSDSLISELDNDHKLFYIYLMTNERTRQCGVYEITKRQIAFDLGYTIDRVSILLKYFINRNKIKYNEKTNELALGNWLKYNGSTSPKVQSCINKEFSLVKDTLLIEYVKSMDTYSQEEQEEEEEQQQEEEQYKPKVFNFKNSLIDLGVQPDIIKDWLLVRKNKKATNSETAFNSIKTEIEKTNLNANDCIKLAVEKSWSGFNSEWVKTEPEKKQGYTLADGTKILSNIAF